MAYYVRKIARAKWNLLDPASKDIIENYKADTIANDLRTTGNTLSFWKSESLDEDVVEPIVLINSLMGDKIKTIDLLFVPDTMMSSYELSPVDGDTVLEDYCKLHYNLIRLSVRGLLGFANDVVLKMLSSAEKHPELVRRLKERDQLMIICKWIDNGKLSYEKLKDGQKSDITEFKRKHWSK